MTSVVSVAVLLLASGSTVPEETVAVFEILPVTSGAMTEIVIVGAIPTGKFDRVHVTMRPA